MPVEPIVEPIVVPTHETEPIGESLYPDVKYEPNTRRPSRRSRVEYVEPAGDEEPIREEAFRETPSPDFEQKLEKESPEQQTQQVTEEILNQKQENEEILKEQEEGEHREDEIIVDTDAFDYDPDLDWEPENLQYQPNYTSPSDPRTFDEKRRHERKVRDKKTVPAQT